MWLAPSKAMPYGYSAQLLFLILSVDSHHTGHDGSDVRNSHGCVRMSGTDKAMENMKDMKMDCMDDASAKASSMAEREVKAVDKPGKSITLKHGAIKSKTVEMGP